MKIGRNEPCPCGSGKKYKKCRLLNESAPPAAVEAPKERTAEVAPNRGPRSPELHAPPDPAREAMRARREHFGKTFEAASTLDQKLASARELWRDIKGERYASAEEG